MAQPYVLLNSTGSDQAEEWLRLGLESQLAGKFPDAERHYRQTLRLDPRHAPATQNLAILFAQMGNVQEALLAIERAAIFDQKHSIIHTNRAFMNLEADRIDEALAAAHHAVSISSTYDTPGTRESYINSRLALAMISATAGLPDQAVRLYNEILDVDPKHALANPNSCFVMTLTTATPADMLAQRQRWYTNNKFDGEKRPHPNDRTAGRKLRIGYISGDFKRHSAAMIFGAAALNHNREAVEPFYYTTLPVDSAADPMTKQFKTAAGQNWRDITTVSDADAEIMIRNDKIDILVDLAAHTSGGRLTLFCRKPAPVQVTAWGFAHGTGLPEIDYFFADPVVLPPEERQHYAEQIVDLPCIVSYVPPLDYNLKAKSMMPFHKNDFITFGCYSRYEKLSDQCLATFAEILRRVPDSKIEFKDHAFRRPYSIRRVIGAMPDIASERLLFSISSHHPDHMLAYQQADLILDPFPHVGGVVCLEQLYMSVPIVTLYGSQPAGRTTSSVLTNLNRADWIARTPEQYVEIATKLANDIPTLQKARKTLRDELMASPVVAGYAAAVERAYREIWRRYCQQ